MVKLKFLKLGQKFTLLLSIVFLIGIAASGLAMSRILNQGAQAQVTSKALMLMETMNSVRNYTSTQVNPELSPRLEEEFLPETVPSYSAREVFETLRASPDYSDFFYKEATLNPTNLRDKADAFEEVLVNNFRSQSASSEVSGFRTTPAGQVYYIARPIQIRQESCLECHSSPSVAPASMIERYGDQNGFDWTLNEIVGAQVISVPAVTVLNSARRSLLLTMAIFTTVFAVVILAVNYWLNRFVVRPLKRMSATAETVSMGDTDAEFPQTTEDEVGMLAQSFNRMRMSLQMAMQRLDRYRSERRDSSGAS